jgi:hypothetical protein
MLQIMALFSRGRPATTYKRWGYAFLTKLNDEAIDRRETLTAPKHETVSLIGPRIGNVVERPIVTYMLTR